MQGFDQKAPEMQLDREQRRQFNEQGFLFFPALFSSDEVSILQTAAAQIMQQNGPHVVRGLDTNAVRVAYGAHLTDETFQRLGRHPRIIGLAEQLLDNQVYIHQSRLNPKVALQGDLWNWHQDFATWHDRDGQQEPRARMIGVFLEDASESNGPLMVIPGSHRHWVGFVSSAKCRHSRGFLKKYLTFFVRLGCRHEEARPTMIDDWKNKNNQRERSHQDAT